MIYAAKSDIGLVRSMNQDGYAVVDDLPVGVLFVVADGMGGPQAGDVASRIAVQRVTEYVGRHLSADASPREVVAAAIADANEAIYRQAEAVPAYAGMGTTIVCALALADRMVVAHVGDSRAYALTGGEFRQVTEDHSLVAELVRRGHLSASEARHHPQRNIVTRSLGTEPVSIPDLTELSWEEGDVLLLCSDGLSNLVEDEELRLFLEQARGACTTQDVSAAVDAMIQLALERGGTDNVTALVAVHREEDNNG
ncbi:Stp1/IreP family PP2C-type Ser/Thr phosphatase [Alicyclobacillus mali]|uniref:Stp1/IreP family PP2C-type Ser/Thr phosphatase n=1 Tax=Alicyclobacillus mali (ex Roth et al. 2021) TaxID=1123961 RepID=A0ABS0F2T8_9BACL|nr:Stp1/IreP family PP2C-type Ser/Thr phosphatase [Alicyclobacillus mali (ex Roth et al. 2021)]MBF8377614.1 Stp1/IreP family PP2C-type Ser/Thr phosphatase [Alicyclobacillus mali (ex Roth et al. 2021)]MCL6488556.1 Stp1/IreP family PP2C-type Ser/Thr phosphatase [Alicyclobacillus mali (ex Roth et al. 2021)]